MQENGNDGLAILSRRRGEVTQAYLALLGQLGRSLEPKTKQLVLLALQTTQGSTRALRRHVPRALAAGATVDEVVDAVTMALPIAGLTRVTEALAAVEDLLEGGAAGAEPRVAVAVAAR
jgi:alkylhydroperoxidase/carboxymuconolactone decarboxylase family protein YurZ